MGVGRVLSSLAGVTALVGVVLAAIAVARPGAGRRRRALAAVALGAIGMVVGGLVVATADGGVGTGNGLGGGVVAAALGLIGVGVGSVALARAH